MKDIDSLSEEEAKELLKSFVADKVVLAEAIEKYSKNIMTEEKKAAISLMHSVMCPLPHEVGQCEWYREEQLDDTWHRPCHKFWVVKMAKFMETYRITSVGGPAGVVERLKSLMKIEEVIIEESLTLDAAIEFLIARNEWMCTNIEEEGNGPIQDT